MTARLLCFMGWHRWWYKFPDDLDAALARFDGNGE